jgi:hypothetical protein
MRVFATFFACFACQKALSGVRKTRTEGLKDSGLEDRGPWLVSRGRVVACSRSLLAASLCASPLFSVPYSLFPVSPKVEGESFGGRDGEGGGVRNRRLPLPILLLGLSTDRFCGYRHAGNSPCRPNVVRSSPRLFADELLTGGRRSSRDLVNGCLALSAPILQTGLQCWLQAITRAARCQSLACVTGERR